MSSGAGFPTVTEARRALEAARVGRDPKAVGDAEVHLGAAQFETDLVAEAAETFAAAERTYAGGWLAREAAIARLNLARSLSALDRREEAEALYQAVAAEQATSDLMLAWEAWGQLADHFDRTGEPGRRAALFERLLSEAAASGDELRIAYFENWVGRQLFERRDLSGGTPLLTSAARRYEALGRTDLVARALMVQGAAHHEGGEHHQAADCFTRALAAYEALGDEQGATAARQNLGIIS